MIVHSSRLSIGFAPLIAEAKRRMRRRRSLVALLVGLVCLAVGLPFALRSGGSGAPIPLTSSLRALDVEVSVPQGFRHTTIPGCCGLVTGQVLTDIRLPAGYEFWGVLQQWEGSGPPSNGVVLHVQWWPGSGPSGGKQLQVPLTLEQSWSKTKLNNGAVGLRYGWFRLHNERYIVEYWSGPNAPAADRAAILRALESIRPAR